MDALFVLTSKVDDWSGYGPAIIQWAAWQADAARLPWSLSEIVTDHADLSGVMRDEVKNAIARFFTRDEALLLGRHLADAFPVWNAPIRYAQITLPLTAAEALAMQTTQTHKRDGPLWRIQPPDGAIPGLPLPIEGVVSLWPWPELDPENIAPLMAMRERLGLDPLPPLPGSDAP